MALDPELVDAHLALGRVAAAQRRTRDAEAAFRAALRLDPECGLAHRQLASLPIHFTGRSQRQLKGDRFVECFSDHDFRIDFFKLDGLVAGDLELLGDDAGIGH